MWLHVHISAEAPARLRSLPPLTFWGNGSFQAISLPGLMLQGSCFAQGGRKPMAHPLKSKLNLNGLRADKLESKGPKADFLLWKPAVNSKLSQNGMKGHHKVKCLEQ